MAAKRNLRQLVRQFKQETIVEDMFLSDDNGAPVRVGCYFTYEGLLVDENAMR